MEIPKKIKIGGIIYRIDQSEELADADGICRSRDSVIKICKTIPQDTKEMVLFHEILEAGCSPLGETETGHSLLDMISKLFYQVLKDNDLLK